MEYVYESPFNYCACMGMSDVKWNHIMLSPQNVTFSHYGIMLVFGGGLQVLTILH